MPNIVRFTRSIEYDLEAIAHTLKLISGEGYVPTEEECLEEAHLLATDDFGCEWGHHFDGYLEMEVLDE